MQQTSNFIFRLRIGAMRKDDWIYVRGRRGDRNGAVVRVFETELPSERANKLNLPTAWKEAGFLCRIRSLPLSLSPSLRRIIGRVPWKFFCRQILKVLTTEFSSRFENYDIGAWSTIHRKLDQPIVLKPVREALKLSVTSSNWIYRFDGSVSVAAAKVRANF